MESSQQMSKGCMELITRPDVNQAWYATSEVTLPTIFGTENTVLPVPDIKHSKIYEPFAVIGRVKHDGGKYLKYLGKLQDLANTSLLTPEQLENLNNKQPETVPNSEVSANADLLEEFKRDYIGLSSVGGKLQEKTVNIELEGIKSCDISLEIDELNLDPVQNPQLIGVSKVFVIYQSYYAKRTKVKVNITDGEILGEESSESKSTVLDKISNTIKSCKTRVPAETGSEEYEKCKARPIGFKVAKFELDAKTAALTPSNNFDAEKFRKTDWIQHEI